MPTRSETLAKAASLRAIFETQGAQLVEPPILQPAGTLLDLYGEDIRARAYVTSDALRGEQMLRPDYTVPVVQMHMDQGAEPARYTYAGEVFRRQEDHPERASEYVQVGYEVFDRNAPAAADAEVYALIAEALRGVAVRPITGDIGILRAAVEGLETSAVRKRALMRHIWRPQRFRALLERYSGRKPMPETRLALLEGEVRSDAPLTGVRSQAEIDARIEVLRADAETPPISTEEVALIEALLTVKAAMPQALDVLHTLGTRMRAIVPAVDRLAARDAALRAKGVATGALLFEARFGRTSMEYYDGFVFAFYAEKQPEMAAIASGGRYDALTRQLGKGREIPAVGGVMRPGLILALEGEA